MAMTTVIAILASLLGVCVFLGVAFATYKMTARWRHQDMTWIEDQERAQRRLAVHRGQVMSHTASRPPSVISRQWSTRSSIWSIAAPSSSYRKHTSANYHRFPVGWSPSRHSTSHSLRRNSQPSYPLPSRLPTTFPISGRPSLNNRPLSRIVHPPITNESSHRGKFHVLTPSVEISEPNGLFSPAIQDQRDKSASLDRQLDNLPITDHMSIQSKPDVTMYENGQIESSRRSSEFSTAKLTDPKNTIPTPLESRNGLRSTHDTPSQKEGVPSDYVSEPPSSTRMLPPKLTNQTDYFSISHKSPAGSPKVSSDPFTTPDPFRTPNVSHIKDSQKFKQLSVSTPSYDEVRTPGATPPAFASLTSTTRIPPRSINRRPKPPRIDTKAAHDYDTSFLESADESTATLTPELARRASQGSDRSVSTLSISPTGTIQQSELATQSRPLVSSVPPATSTEPPLRKPISKYRVSVQRPSDVEGEHHGSGPSSISMPELPPSLALRGKESTDTLRPQRG